MAIARFVSASLGAFGGLILSLPLIMITLSFWLVSCATRKIAIYFERGLVPWQQIMEFDKSLGWRVKAGVHAKCLAEPAGDIFKISTDGQGWRGHGKLNDSDVIVFGDSFAFGYGVDDADCFFVSHGNDVKIKAIGVPGYNMVQELLCMQTLAPQLTDKLVVWFVYAGNDIYDNLKPNHIHYRRPFVRKTADADGWEICSGHVSTARWPYHSGREVNEHHEMLGNTYSSSFIAERAYSACEFLINTANSALKRVGAKLVVVTVPDVFELSDRGTRRLLLYSADPNTFDPNYPHRRIGHICNALGVDFVSAKDFLRLEDYSSGDRHWTPKGHRSINKLVFRLHAEHTGTGGKWVGAASMNGRRVVPKSSLNTII